MWIESKCRVLVQERVHKLDNTLIYMYMYYIFNFKNAQNWLYFSKTVLVVIDWLVCSMLGNNHQNVTIIVWRRVKKTYWNLIILPLDEFKWNDLLIVLSCYLFVLCQKYNMITRRLIYVGWQKIYVLLFVTCLHPPQKNNPTRSLPNITNLDRYETWMVFFQIFILVCI